MRLLVIVTSSRYKLWELAAQGEHFDKVMGEPTLRVGSIANDKVVIFCQAESTKEDDDAKTKEISAKTTPWVIHIANSPPYDSYPEVYIATHSDYVDLKTVRSNIAKERLAACASFNHYPKSPGLDEISDALYPLLSKLGAEAFETALEAVKKKQTLTHAQRLSALKHRLAHLFLPISIDLEAWIDFDFDDEYMKEILKAYKEDYERLARARALLYGEESPSDAESVEKIIKEVDLEGHEAWLKAQSLLPRTEPEIAKEKKEKRDESSYREFFKMQEVLESLKDKDKLKALKPVLKADNPFNKWYVQLETALIELRKVMDTQKRA